MGWRKIFPVTQLRSTWLVFGALLGIVLALPASATTSYTYDALGRLVRVDFSSGNYITYQYDPAGNRTALGSAVTNSAPTANPDSISVNENATITFDPRANDTDPDSDPLTITAATNGAHGTVTNNSGTSLTYTPTAGYYGSDSFSYTISDGQGHFVSATDTVSVVNRAPTAVNDSITSTGDVAVTFDPRTNDSDPEGDGLTITTTGSAAHGTVTINSGTSLTYTPTSGYAGSDSFTYTISDGHGNTATATVSATVTAPNTAPVAVNDTVYFNATTSTGHPSHPVITFDPRTNDHDTDGDTLTITAATNTAHATVTINGGGTSLTYVWPGSYMTLITTDSFTYTISDGHGYTATATVTVNIDIEGNQ